MKKILLILMLLAIVVGTASAGGLTYDQANYKKYRANSLTAFGNDPIFNFINEVDGMLDGTGTSTITNLLFDNSVTSDPTSTEGRLYYNSSTKKLKYYNASSWITIEAGASGNSLDGAYNVGRSIAVDAGSVILTGSDAGDNVVLAIIQSDTGSTVSQTITSAGTGALLSFDSNGTGADVLGSDSTWTVTKAGASTFVGVTTTGELLVTAADVLFDDTYDVAWDTSRDTFLFQDNAILGLGGAHDDPADTWFIHDGTNLSLLSLTADEGLLIGGTTAGFDITYAFETAGQIRTDYDADFLNFTDDMDLRFGTGGSADGDFQISSNSSNLLTIDVVVAGTGEVAVGNDADDVTWKWYAETKSDCVYFNADEVEFEDVVLQMMDATQIQFGDSDDFFMHATNQAMTMGTLTSDETSAWNFGADTDGDDVKMFGATTSEYWLFDASADSLLPVLGNYLYTATDAEADQFKVDATGTVAGVAINFETTDGKVLINADGGTWGDIELNSADDIILTTAGKLTITNGSEAMTVSGALTVAGVTTLNGTLVGDGATTTVGLRPLLEAYTGADNVLTIAESGTTFTNTGDGDGSLHTLPEASTALGMYFTFSVTAAQTLTVNPKDGTDQIQGLTNAAGDSISSAAVGDSITLLAAEDDTWVVVSTNNSNGNADAWVDAN